MCIAEAKFIIITTNYVCCNKTELKLLFMLRSDVQQLKTKGGIFPSIQRPKSVDFSRYASSTWKGSN